MFFSLAQITGILVHSKYLVLFPFVVVEGPIVSILAGFLISLGIFGFFPALITIIAGDLVGDSLHYAIGRWGRKKFIDRWGEYFGITNDRVLRFEQRFTKHKTKTLLLGKISHGVGGIPLVAAGAVNMPFGEFLLINLAATVPKSLLLLLVGYYYGQAAEKIKSDIELVGYITIGIALLAGSAYFFYFRKKNNSVSE